MLLGTAQRANKSQERSLSGPHLISGEMIIDQFCVDRFLITAPKSPPGECQSDRIGAPESH